LSDTKEENSVAKKEHLPIDLLGQKDQEKKVYMDEGKTKEERFRTMKNILNLTLKSLNVAPDISVDEVPLLWH